MHPNRCVRWRGLVLKYSPGTLFLLRNRITSSAVVCLDRYLCSSRFFGLSSCAKHFSRADSWAHPGSNHHHDTRFVCLFHLRVTVKSESYIGQHDVQPMSMYGKICNKLGRFKVYLVQIDRLLISWQLLPTSQPHQGKGRKLPISRVP